MKSVLIEDYRNLIYKALARSVLSSLFLENKKIPFTVAMDSSIIHFKPWYQIVFNPSVKSAWKIILERYYETDAYKKLNSAVAGDPLLAKYATIHFLNTLFKKSKEQLKQLKQQQQQELSKKDKEGPVGSLMKLIDKQPSPEASRAVQAIVSALEKEAEEVLQDIEAIESFSHLGVPVANLLDKPDEFREKARNKIIVYLVKFLQRLKREAPSLKQTKYPTLIGGRPLGVKKLQRWSELTSVLPFEYLDDDLLSYKITSRSIRVSERRGSIQNYVVYLDKCIASGTLIPLVNDIKPIEDIEVGDVVLGANFVQEKRTVLKPSSRIQPRREMFVRPLLTAGRVVEKRYSGVQKVIRITTAIGESIVLTPNHIVYAVRRGGKDIVEVPAGSLSVGDYLLVATRYDTPNNPRLSPRKKEKCVPLPLPPNKLGKGSILKKRPCLTGEIAQILGYICGDGHISISTKTSSAYIGITDDNDVNRLVYRELITKYFDVSVKLVDRDRKRLQVNSRPLTLYLKTAFPEIVRRSRERSVPKLILENRSTEVIRGFLRGLFDAEGFVGDHQVGIATTSKTLAEQVRYLLLCLGIYSKIYKGKNPPRRLGGYIIKATDFYWVIISTPVHVERFLKYVGFSDEKKNEKIRQYLMRVKRRQTLPRGAKPLGKSHFVLSPIVSIEPAGEAPTWDLVIEGYHNFIANNILVHNSGSMADDIKYYVSPTRIEHVPKISFAAASALALAHQLRRFGAKMTLKLFDVEVHDTITDFSQLIDTLLKIEADSGTNINNVLEDAVKNYRNEKIVVVTDGIDDVSEEAVKSAKSANLDITFVFIKTDNPLLKKNFKCVRIEEAKPSILLEV